jgi:lactoylglutathione lyase
MHNQIALITILTDDVSRLVAFYREALGFKVILDMKQYVEFESIGVRFAVCARTVLHQASGHASYMETRRGHAFELAFPCESPSDVDRAYSDILAKGATPIHEPVDMPWNQRTAMFADPDGNIHELFADLPQK